MLLLLLSHFSHVWLSATPEMAAHQAPLSLGFSRQEHWSGLPFPSPMHEHEKWKWSHSVVSDSSWPHGLQPTRILHPWDFPGKSTGVGCHCLLRYGHENQTIKKAECLWTAVLEKNLESSLNCKMKPVNPKGNQLWIYTGRTDAEAPILWPPDANRQFIGKDPDAGKDWRPKEKEGGRAWDGWNASST